MLLNPIIIQITVITSLSNLQNMTQLHNPESRKGFACWKDTNYQPAGWGSNNTIHLWGQCLDLVAIQISTPLYCWNTLTTEIPLPKKYPYPILLTSSCKLILYAIVSSCLRLSSWSIPTIPLINQTNSTNDYCKQNRITLLQSLHSQHFIHLQSYSHNTSYISSHYSHNISHFSYSCHNITRHFYYKGLLY